MQFLQNLYDASPALDPADLMHIAKSGREFLNVADLWHALAHAVVAQNIVVVPVSWDDLGCRRRSATSSYEFAVANEAGPRRAHRTLYR